jgi:integrase
MKVRCREGYREGYSKMVRERSERRLKSKNLDSLSPGWHEDGGGLRFRVESKGSRTWVLRLTINGIRRNRGLGPYPLVTLDMARDRALDFRRAAREGRDLAQEERQKLARATTFRQAYEAYFENKARELQESRHLVQWPSMMNAYVLPKIGARPVGDITHADIIDVLKPIWFAKPETARRVLQRMHAVFESSILRGQREKANPRAGISKELGPRHQNVEHHRAMPYAKVPAFIQQLRTSKARSALALEWLILTATRSGETRGATWAEIDENKALWTIPPKRMKMKRAHQIPLPPRCLKILGRLRATYPAEPHHMLFPGAGGRPMSDMTLTKLLRDWGLANEATVHGFRSSFKDWCAEVPTGPKVPPHPRVRVKEQAPTDAGIPSGAKATCPWGTGSKRASFTRSSEITWSGWLMPRAREVSRAS